jgi:phosphoribosylformimino-5-aminoimidazole carboxamide ribotide isomerase
MIIFPAIDLHRGRCVRLRQGQRDAETLYSDEPLAVARQWAVQGAEWLHVVNLDGAFELDSANFHIAAQIAATVNIPIQLGGGLRTRDGIAEALEAGIARVILGTVALHDPGLVAQSIEEFGAERIVVSIDARGGMVALRGWQEISQVSALVLARAVRRQGIRRIVYTDIARDGMLAGPNVQATRQLAAQTGLQVIASGGVASLDDIRALRDVAPSGIEGVIIGQALYSGAISLPNALALARGPARGGDT